MVNIRIINPKSISIFSYYIKIFDKKGLVSSGVTKNNKYKFNNKSSDIHKVQIYNKYIYPCFKEYIFIPKDNINFYFYNNQVLTFKLVDKLYKIPIKEGKIYLWKTKKK